MFDDVYMRKKHSSATISPKIEPVHSSAFRSPMLWLCNRSGLNRKFASIHDVAFFSRFGTIFFYKTDVF